MHITDSEQIEHTYQHVYLSPHLDDAALSCGGAIARHAGNGSHVLVVTLCTAIPDAREPFSAFAAAMHERWQLEPSEVVFERLHEDTQALERLGADIYWAGLPDAIYRMPTTYTSNELLFGKPAANDPARQQLARLLNEVRARAPQATFYVPLAVGNHVDHQLVFDVTVEQGWGRSSAFYEDIPYVLRPNALEERMHAIRRQFVSSIIDIDATLRRKLGAIACYTSQMNELFGGEAAMYEQVTMYHEQLRPEEGTYGERVWVMV